MAVQPHGMHFIQIGQGIIFSGQSTDRANVGHVSIHGVHTLKRDQLGGVCWSCGQFCLKVVQVIMFKNNRLRSPSPLDARDHGGMVQAVGKTDPAGHGHKNCLQTGLVGHITRNKEQPRLLAMQGGKFGLKLVVQRAGTRNVARTPGTCAMLTYGGNGGILHFGDNTHAQIVVGGPDDNLTPFGHVGHVFLI